MHRLLRALRLFSRSPFTWARCWELAKRQPHYQVVARDGFLYVEPRRRGPDTIINIRSDDIFNGHTVAKLLERLNEFSRDGGPRTPR